VVAPPPPITPPVLPTIPPVLPMIPPVLPMIPPVLPTKPPAFRSPPAPVNPPLAKPPPAPGVPVLAAGSSEPHALMQLAAKATNPKPIDRRAFIGVLRILHPGRRTNPTTSAGSLGTAFEAIGRAGTHNSSSGSYEVLASTQKCNAAVRVNLTVMNAVKGLVALLLAVTLPGCGGSGQPKTGGTSDTQALPIPKDLEGDIERSITIGRALYLQDKASAIGTDVLLSKIPEAEKQTLGGYVTLQDAGDDGKPTSWWSVYFFTRDEPPRVAHRVHVPMERGNQPRDDAFLPPEDAPPGLAFLIRARQTAISVVHPTEQPMNPALVPGAAAGEDGVLVYLLAGTTRPRTAVLGKHYRVLVSSDGKTVQYVKPLSKSILELPIANPSGDRPEALAVTHLVSDYPLETHVLASLQHDLPIYVATRRGIWAVNRDSVRFVSGPPN
jgi:hypothetical protein